MKKLSVILLCAVMMLAVFTGCKKQEAEVNVAVKDVYDAIAAAIGEDKLYASMELDETTLSTLYTIDTADVEEFYGTMPLMNVNAEEFLIVKAKEGKVDTIKSAMEARKTALEEQWKTYLPEVYEYVQKAEIVSNGNYIMIAISPEHATAVTEFNNLTTAK